MPGLQTLRKPVVFVMADVLAGFPEKFQRLVQTAGMICRFIQRGMILQVLTVFNSRFPYLPDRGIDPANRLDLIHGLAQLPGRCSIIQRAARRSDKACR